MKEDFLYICIPLGTVCYSCWLVLQLLKCLPFIFKLNLWSPACDWGSLAGHLVQAISPPAPRHPPSNLMILSGSTQSSPQIQSNWGQIYEHLSMASACCLSHRCVNWIFTWNLISTGEPAKQHSYWARIIFKNWCYTPREAATPTVKVWCSPILNFNTLLPSLLAVRFQKHFPVTVFDQVSISNSFGQFKILAPTPRLVP